MLVCFRHVLAVVLCLLLRPDALWAEIGAYETHVVNVITNDSNNTELGFPSIVFFDREAAELYVVHSGQGSQIAIYGGGDYFPTLTLGVGRGVERCASVFVTAKGQLMVSKSPAGQGAKSQISIYDGAFFKVEDITIEGFPGDDEFTPRHIVEGLRGRLVMAGNNYAGALVFDRNGRYLHTISPTDTVRGGRQKSDIVSLATDQEGRLYLLSEGMGRVYVYDREERYLFRFGEKGGSSGKLARARGIAVDDRTRRVYVVDYLRHSINVYDMDGNYLFEFGGQGTGRGWFSYPTDICVDGLGRVVVADLFNKRVQIFEVSQK